MDSLGFSLFLKCTIPIDFLTNVTVMHEFPVQKMYPILRRVKIKLNLKLGWRYAKIT